jgi:hypothetical protein
VNSTLLPGGLLEGCVDLYEIELLREVDRHRAKRWHDQRVLVDGSAKGRLKLILSWPSNTVVTNPFTGQNRNSKCGSGTQI